MKLFSIGDVDVQPGHRATVDLDALTRNLDPHVNHVDERQFARINPLAQAQRAIAPCAGV